LQVGGSREAERTRRRRTGRRLELCDKRLEILLVEIEWRDEYHQPEDGGHDDAEQLMPPYGACETVSILRERVYLFKLSFYLRVHMFLIYNFFKYKIVVLNMKLYKLK
jgi:hypothetical protein